jgi:hypothetical protein
MQRMWNKRGIYNCKRMCFVPRTRTNLQIVESALFSQLHNSFHSEWQDGLDFLSNFQLNRPPPFRQSLITKVKWILEENICGTFTTVIEISKEALKKPTHHRFNRTSEFDPTSYFSSPCYSNNSSYNFPSILPLKMQISSKSSTTDSDNSNKANSENCTSNYNKSRARLPKNTPTTQFQSKSAPKLQLI